MKRPVSRVCRHMARTVLAAGLAASPAFRNPSIICQLWHLDDNARRNEGCPVSSKSSSIAFVAHPCYGLADMPNPVPLASKEEEERRAWVTTHHEVVKLAKECFGDRFSNNEVGLLLLAVLPSTTE